MPHPIMPKLCSAINLSAHNLKAHLQLDLRTSSKLAKLTSAQQTISHKPQPHLNIHVHAISNRASVYSICRYRYCDSCFIHAVGTFNQTEATEYCLTVNDVVLLGSPFNDDNME